MSEIVTRAARWEEAAAEADRRRDEVCEQYLACFGTPAGQRVLLDLEAFVYRQVVLPDRPEAELRDHMGQKRLLGIIIERIEHGRRTRATGGTAGSPAPSVGRPGRASRRSTRKPPAG